MISFIFDFKDLKNGKQSGDYVTLSVKWVLLVRHIRMDEPEKRLRAGYAGGTMGWCWKGIMKELLVEWWRVY